VAADAHTHASLIFQTVANDLRIMSQRMSRAERENMAEHTSTCSATGSLAGARFCVAARIRQDLPQIRADMDKLRVNRDRGY
jgi:hypothetical protein